MTPEEIIKHLRQALRDGDTVVIVERGFFVQVGLRGQDGETLNVTAAVCKAFDLPHMGGCIQASETQIRQRIERVSAAQPVIVQPIQRSAASNAAHTSVDKDVIDALRALGYTAAESKEAVSAIPAETVADFETRFRVALGEGKAVTL